MTYLRVPSLAYSLGIGVPLLLPGLVHLMPHAAIDGVLAFVGTEGTFEFRVQSLIEPEIRTFETLTQSTQ